MQQEVILAMLAKEPSHGYQLRARLRDALGPLGDAMNAGHVYVTLTRLEKAGLLAAERSADGADHRRDLLAIALADLVAEHAADHGSADRSDAAAARAVGVDFLHRLDHAALGADGRNRDLRRGP